MVTQYRPEYSVVIPAINSLERGSEMNDLPDRTDAVFLHCNCQRCGHQTKVQGTYYTQGHVDKPRAAIVKLTPAQAPLQLPDGWESHLEELLVDYGGAMAETALFNAQVRGSQVRLPKPRRIAILRYVGSLLKEQS